MLNGTKQSINPSANDGTATARAVMKGLKQKDWHDSVFQIRAFFALLIAVIVGFATHNAITGFVVFVLLGAWIRYRYYHE